MRRILTRTLCATTLGLAALVGCTSQESGTDTVEIDEAQLAEQFESEAESEITKDNAESVLSDLEKEIAADEESGQ